MEEECEEEEYESEEEEYKEEESVKMRESPKVQWFITYPQCPVTKENIKDILFKKMKDMNNDIKEYVIAREKHKDGNEHIHAYINLRKKIRWRQDLFDFIYENINYHGNYQPCKYKRKTIEYLKKDGDYICDKDEDIYKAKNELILNNNLNDLVKQGKISIFNLPTLYKAKNIYSLDTKNVDFIIDRKCFWIYGEPGIGKSYIVREVYPNLYNKPRSKWWDGYTDQDVVLLDDFDKDMLFYCSELKIWADKYLFEGETKGGFCRPNYTKFFVTSNYDIDELFLHKDKQMFAAIFRRFIRINYKDREKDHDNIINIIK